ncbi:MAG: PAS domain S-box protein [Candidatus Nomurabacteria bacterium]|nr:MAG: PAS domain S-box protein [Candidatus Nomurabacteria bacterium]
MSHQTVNNVFLDCQQAADYLSVSVKTIRRWAQSGKLKGKKVGSRGDWRFTHDQLDQLVHGQEDDYEIVKQFLHQHASDIERLAIEKYHTYLSEINLSSNNIGKNSRFHVEIIKSLADNLKNEAEGMKKFDKLGRRLATSSLEKGLTVQEVHDGIRFLKRAMWEMVENSKENKHLTLADIYSLKKIFSTYKDILTSKILIAYQDNYQQAQKALEYGEEKFAKMFHVSPVAMTLSRASDGEIIDVNECYLEMMDCKRLDVVGHSVVELDGESGHIASKRLQQLKAIGYAKKRTEFETEIVTKTGMRRRIRGAYIALKINGEKHIITSHFDVTEQLKVEGRNQYLAALTTNIADAVVSLDNKHNVVSWNKGAEKLYGWKKEEVIGKKLSSLLHQRPVSGITLKELRQVVADKGVWRGESVHRRKDGSSVDVNTSAASIKDENGKIIGRVAVYRDISARKQAERSLAERETRYRLLFDSIAAGFCVVEVLENKQGKAYDYRFLEVNPAYEKMVGVSNMQGKTLQQLTPAVSDKWVDVAAGVAVTGKDSHVTSYSSSVDKWFDVHVMKVGTGNDKTVALLVRDVTEHKNIEQEREVSMKKIISTLESISDAFFQVDEEGNIVLVNDEFVRMSRISRKKALSSNIKNVFSSESWFPKRYEMFQKVMATGRSVHYVDYYERRKIWVDVRAYPTEGGVSWFIKDITQQKVAEEKQIMLTKLSLEREELIKIGRVKDEFIGIASHQLRTPATAVKQYIGMLLAGFGGTLNDDQRQYLETAYASNERQIKLINDLLKTAQIDADTYSLSRSTQHIAPLLKSAVLSHKPYLDNRQQIVVVKDQSDGAEADIDPIEIDLVFANLLENASKYSPKKSKITVALQREADVLRISFSDEGIGIRKEDQGKIFDKFTRVHNEHSDAVSGTGLGLYWVRQIVQMHGGTVTVSSRLHKGSTFTVTLPL